MDFFSMIFPRVLNTTVQVSKSCVIDRTASHFTKPASWQVAGYPAQAGIQSRNHARAADKTKLLSPFVGDFLIIWIPACAGMTVGIIFSWAASSR
ncbi:MAG: hypothetical protein GJU76_11075 [Gallionella sp.]|jgi:hypothetical protein|nr:hypothetical protein [Gallionella sp.]